MSNYKNVYWIGGSPCAGKSSVAELLCEEFNFNYYKCDDHYDEHVNKGSAENVGIMKWFSSSSIDEIWLRDVKEMTLNEIKFYQEEIKFILDDISKYPTNESLVVEGAAIMPEVIESIAVDIENYVCIVPSKEFQLEKYAERDWVKGYLSECSDYEQAYKNWMNRDIEFALKMKESAQSMDMKVIVVDGLKTISENYEVVKKYFRL